MNAPARFPRPIRLDPTPQEVAYAAAISIHCPNCDEMELAARCDIAAMRDAASVGMAKASDSACTLLGEVVRMASHSVYAPVPASQLIRVKAALTLTMMAAREIERVQRDG